MRWLFAVTLVAASVQATALPDPAVAQGGVVDRPFAVTVVNKNTSQIPCPADGRVYTLRGSLVAPANRVSGGRGAAVTVLVHGAMLPGDTLWRMRPGGDESFDFALRMARLGHAVVSMELPGYGDTVSADAPNGALVCQGSMADVIHQVVDKLRAGDYQLGGAAGGPAFKRVAIAGFSFGGQYVQAAAYSFPDIDALVVMGWADPFVPSEEGVQFTSGTQLACFNGGEPKFDDGSGPPDYVERPGDLAVKVQWYEPVAPAEEYWKAHIERDPCGLQTSYGGRFVADMTGLARVHVPVLVADGDHDELVGWLGPRVLFARLTGTPDRTLMLFPGAGHSFFLEKRRAQWTAKIAGWLGKRGF